MQLLSYLLPFSAFLAVASAPTSEAHEIAVILAVDNHFTLFIDGQVSEGPQDGPGNNYAWKQVKTYNQTVHGSGPWLVAIEGRDKGTIGGFIGAVYLDGELYTVSGIEGNKFILTDSPAKATVGWNTDLSFDASSWESDVVGNCFSSYPTWTAVGGANWIDNARAQIGNVGSEFM